MESNHQSLLTAAEVRAILRVGENALYRYLAA
jgi:hypothetical protein